MSWHAGEAYTGYMGRWSRLVATGFVDWLGRPAGQRWLDVGCGTGELSAAVLAAADPAAVRGVDPSEAFLTTARDRIADPRATFTAGSAEALPVPDRSVDALVSGLSLNFVPDRPAALAEAVRVVAPGGAVAGYVWDYAEGMGMLRVFWDAVRDLDPGSDADEGHRFEVCRPEPLRSLWTGAGLAAVEVRPITVPQRYADFDDYWQPFLAGIGPAGAYLAGLPADRLNALRDLVRDRLPADADGAIELTARAWAVRGTRA